MRLRSLRAILLLLLAIMLHALPANGGEPRQNSSRSYHDVYFWSLDAGWIADFGELVLTRDGGRTWTPIVSRYEAGSDFNAIFRVQARSPQIWWFEASERDLWVTTDGGKNWQTWPRVLRNADGTIRRTIDNIVLVSPTEAWGIGKLERDPLDNALYHTRDGGHTWRAVRLRVPGAPGLLAINGLFFLPPHTGWVAFMHGQILRTTDGGQSWEFRGKTPNDVFTFLFVDPLNGWALDAQRPKIYRTRDGGATWQMGTTPPLDPTSRLSKIFFWDKMTGWVVGLQGAILKTIDGGETWSVQPIGEKYRSLSGIHFSDQEHGWVVGEYNTILKTSDGGQTWQKVTDDLKDWQPPRLGG